MAKFKVILGRLGRTQCFEVGHFLGMARMFAHTDPRVEDLIDAPCHRVPTPVTRNLLVKKAQEHGCDILFMIDEDMVVPPSFFKAAVDFLVEHEGPAAIAVPYCMGPPNEEVCVFEWGQPETGRKAPFCVVNISREDAARRKGIEEVANIGTGCIAYRLDAFKKIKPPYYDYAYADETHTDVIETEDCYAHRKLHFAGVPLYVSWDHWSGHHKAKLVGKPQPIERKHIEDVYMAQARAEVLHEQRKEVNGTTANGHTMVKVDASKATVESAKVARDVNTDEPLLISLRDAAYIANATRLLPRPKLKPQAAPFSAEDAVAFAQSVEGWMSDAELIWLAEQAAQLDADEMWVEVGCWKGRSTSAVTLATTATVYAVDTFEGSPNERNGSHKRADESFADFLELRGELERLRGCHNPFVMHNTSVIAAREFGDASTSVVFLDGDHTREAVEADLRAWLPKIKPGGMICGHDAGVRGVQEALRDVAPELGLDVQDGPGAIWFASVPVPAGVGE